MVDAEVKGNGYGRQYFAPQVVAYDNEYFNDEYLRTYKELHLYYKHPTFYNPAGFYSDKYHTIYYDGYGYNFYYANTGYYEYSRAPVEIKPGKWNFWEFIRVFIIMLVVLAVYSWIYYYMQTRKKKIDAKD